MSSHKSEPWPLDYVARIVKTPRSEWSAHIESVPAHLQTMVRTHLQCYVDRMRCAKEISKRGEQ